MDDFERDVQRAMTQLTALDRAIIRALPLGVAAGARLLRTEAEMRVPRRSGELAASSFDEAVEHDTTTAVHRVGFRKFYALPVDRGHPIRAVRGGPVVGRARATQFISEPVARLRQSKIARAVTKTVSDAVDQEIKRFYGR